MLSLQDLHGIIEVRDRGTFKHLAFWTIIDLELGTNQAWFGKLEKPWDQVTVQDLSNALGPTSDWGIFPSKSPSFTVAPHLFTDTICTHTPLICEYRSNLDNRDEKIGNALGAAASLMENLVGHPLQYVATYHGVRERRGRITGLVFDSHETTLKKHVESGWVIDVKTIMAGLYCAAGHLHNLGIVHCHINPDNIMMPEYRRPVLVNCWLGEFLGTHVPPKGIAVDPDMHADAPAEWLVTPKRDTDAVEKIRRWLKAVLQWRDRHSPLEWCNPEQYCGPVWEE